MIQSIASADVKLIHNVTGHSINHSKHITFTAMAFEDGKILSTGTYPELIKDYPDATLINGEGHTILPGLHDAHGHVLRLGQLKNEIDLMGVTSLDESLKIIQKFIDDHPQNNWILGRGWNQVLWKGKKFPTHKDLDKLKTNKPIWLSRVDGHAGWANSKAMEIAKSHEHLKDMPGGEIIIDETGAQTGIYIDNAMAIIQKKINRENVLKNEKILFDTLQDLASQGITSVDDAGIDWPTYDAYKTLAAQKKLPIRVNAMLASGSAVLDKMLSDGIYKDDYLQIQTIKYVADGALGSRGAAMIKPYEDRTDTTGKLVQSQAFIEEKVLSLASKGWQAAIHAIGDKANKISIEILSRPQAQTQLLRHRIEHAQIVDFDDLIKFKQYNIIASMQPTHATSDMNMAEDRVGRKRLRGAYAWQTLLKKGVVIASGSDFPVELSNPFYGLHAAITRQDRENQPEQGWIGIEKMTPEQALASFTINAAYTNHREADLGSLQKGKWADFIIIDRDIFSIPVQEIWKTKVLQTWVQGQKSFDAKKS